MVPAIVSVSERHTRNFLVAAKVHYETLFFASLLIFCQPVIGRVAYITPSINLER